MKNLYFLMVAVLGLFQYGCAPTFYIPNRQNVPLLKKKNDIRLSVAKGFGGIELQSAFALSNRIGILLNTVNYNESPDQDGFKDGDGGGTEIGIGYYKPFGSFLNENYISFGKGHFYNRAKFISPHIPEDDGKIDAKFNRISIQNSIAYTHKYFAFYISSRFSRLNYYDIVGNYYDVYDNVGANLNQNPNFILFEPSIGFKVGIKYLKIDVQYLKSFNLGNNYLYQYNTNYSVGLQFSLTD